MLERLTRRFGRGLSDEQEALLGEHRERGSEPLAQLVRDVSRAERRAWNRYLAESGNARFTSPSPWSTETGKRVLAESPETASSVVVMAMANRNLELAVSLTRRKLSYAPEDVVLLFALANSVTEPYNLWDALRVPLAAAAQLPSEQFTPEVRAAVRNAAARIERGDWSGWETERTKLRSRVQKLLGEAEAAEFDPNVITTGDEFGKPLRKALERWRDDPHAGALLMHLAQATSGTTPAKKWQDRARDLVAKTRDGEELLRTILAHALKAPDGTRRFYGDYVYHWLDDANAVLVRGAVWATAAIAADWAVPAFADLGERAGSGFEARWAEPRSVKVANACIRQLGALGTDDAVAVLARMKARIKHKTVGRQIEQALEEAAGAAGMTKGELLERQVPTFGLDPDGRKEVQLGTAVAVVERDELRWLSNGKPVKSVPKAVKDEHAAELRALRAEVKEIKKALSAERVRVESLFAEERVWDVDEWRRLYLDHPLTGAFARGLIWRFGDDSALPIDGTFVRADGSELEPAGEVRLWHPIDVSPQDVAAWRSFLLEREVTQPFKQAFREVYLVAPAERETRTYSNRFAAHILHYRQAYALIRSRGWSVVALGPYDNDGGRQWRDFEPYGIRAEFWMDHADDDFDDMDMLAQLAATDQVRFTPIGGGDPVPIADVPPRVFSEAMRDVDLFVGVASIAADPQWVDQGDRHMGYWREHSFGALTASAETRREVLRELVPQLKIADRLELEERYLRVRGNLREYKIHLGSGNILMEPNDEYLCIVPRGGERLRDVFLPFEDDMRLSVILSKAFLLASDTKITDETILQQIRR